MKKKIIITSIIVVILIAAFIISYYFISASPKFTLFQIKRSIKHRNLSTFIEYIDIKRFSQNVVDQLLSSEQAKKNIEQAQDNKGVSWMKNSLSKGFMNFIKYPMAIAIEEQIKKYVQTGIVVESKNSQTASQDNVFKKAVTIFKSDKTQLQYVNFTQRNDNIYDSKLSFYNSEHKLEINFDLVLKKHGRKWKLTEISNLKEIADLLNKQEM